MRLFFALWPDDEVRKQLRHISKQASRLHRGKPVKADNLHLTLAFLGNVSEQQHACVVERAGQTVFKPFDLCLDHLGNFSRAKVLWLGASDAPAEVGKLAASLIGHAEQCDIELDNRFHPHVTLMRKVKQLQPVAIEPVHWHIDRFCLVQSFTYPEGVQYKVIKEVRCKE